MKTTIATLIMLTLMAVQIKAQTLNKEMITDGQTPYLLGRIDKTALEGSNYKSWFTANYEAYQLNQKLINEIASELKSYSITLFMGTWCGDSKEEVPVLYKVLEACDFPMEQLTVIAVSSAPNMYKQSPAHEEVGLNIHRVPTVIFYKDNKEVNRIVEHPIVTFEDDIKNIITKNDYKSHYQIVSEIDAILKKKGLIGFKSKHTKLLKNYMGKVSSMYELNTYGRILYGTDRKEEAIAVFALNAALFPDQPRSFMSLANTLGATGYKEDAVKVLEDAIKRHPNSGDLKENLELIKSN